MKIRDLVDVAAQPTVVRLDQLNDPGEARWITEGYYITEETERHLRALRSLLAKKTGCGTFLIGHYGSGKSHFLAYLTQQIRGGTFAKRIRTVLPISLLNFKATQNLEAIVEGELGVEQSRLDRRLTWEEIQKRHPTGLVLVMDELSEFLRSKPSQHSFNEDVRFLQFLGEWSQDHPLWIVAALQEQIEHAGDIEYDLYRKIKDRYPIRLLLTPTHVKSLIAGKILRKKADYPRAVEKLASELKSVYPDSSINFADFCEVYPLHPATLDLLEEVRDRFSQSRGIVDFTLTQLLGSEARSIAPFLDQQWGHLLTPDVIVDHFADLLEVQPEFQAIAQKVLPYYRKHISVLYEKKLQQELAWRLLKLLVLAHLSPARRTVDLKEAAEWLLFKVSTIDPQKNLEVIQRALTIMAREGAYIKQEGSRFRLDLEDDSRQSLDRLLARTVEELRGRGDAVFETLVPCLAREEFNPFSLPRDRWHTRKVRWHFHDRELQVFFGGGQPPECAGLALQIGMPWGPPPAGSNCYKITPKQIELTGDVLELAALLQLKERPLAAPVLKRVGERIAGRSSWFAALVRTSYTDVAVMNPSGVATSPPLNARPSSIESWLNSYSEWMLRQTYPQFEKFAPGHGPLAKEAYRQFMKHAMEADICSEQAPDHVKLIREAYLVPMGLMQRRGFEYSINAKLDQHELVSLLMPILEHHPSMTRVYEHLSGPVYGLVPDQIHLLLLTLLLTGEIDILKGNRSYRETYETLSNPIQYDKVVPGSALNVQQLRDLQVLVEGFGIRGPRQWSVLAQRRAIELLRKEGRRQRDRASEFVVKLRAHGEPEELSADVEKYIDQWVTLDKGASEMQGFQHFLHAIGSPERFLAQARELATLPERLGRLISESERYRHLFGYPCIADCPNADIRVQAESLGQPPSLANAEAVEHWLTRARGVYEVYQRWYRTEHDNWWDQVKRHAVWSYRRPRVVASKHLALEELNRQLDALQAKAEAERCPGLGSMEFQPLCRCGFDGKESPIAETLNLFDAARLRLEEAVASFFAQEAVRSRVKGWVDQGLEVNAQTLAYLEGQSQYPEVDNLPLFDQHLAGLELVHQVDADTLLETLGGRTWEKPDLVKAIERLFERFGPRLAIRREAAAPRRGLVAWCLEHALRFGSPLPAVFSLEERRLMAELIEPQWVSQSSLAGLGDLGLGDEAVNRILELILAGQIQAQPGCEDRRVRAAVELLHPVGSCAPEELTQRVGLLYSEHDRFMRIRPREWLSRLDEMANVTLEPDPGRLVDLLKAHINDQWILVDCFGVALVEAVKQAVRDCLPHWKLASVAYGLVSAETTTDAFYASLVEQGWNKPFEKVDSVDALLHSRAPGDFLKLAGAELGIALKRLAPRLDPVKPVVVFGDHGFRLSADGGCFSHGGRSTAERLVPVLRLEPYSRQE